METRFLDGPMAISRDPDPYVLADRDAAWFLTGGRQPDGGVSSSALPRYGDVVKIPGEAEAATASGGA